jgi:hypothetical protein
MQGDKTEATWAIFEYDGSVKIYAQGVGDLEALKNNLADDKALFGYLKVSVGVEKRSKFVFIKWIGPSVRPMQRAKAFDATNQVSKLIKVF